jgi:hypothetical protein
MSFTSPDKLMHAHAVCRWERLATHRPKLRYSLANQPAPVTSHAASVVGRSCQRRLKIIESPSTLLSQTQSDRFSARILMCSCSIHGTGASMRTILVVHERLQRFSPIGVPNRRHRHFIELERDVVGR